jgi:signal transduction histidine kinase
MSPAQRIALLVVADGVLRHRLVAALLRAARPSQLPLAGTLAEGQLRAARMRPAVILLDESAVGEAPLEDAVNELAPFAPVVVVASAARQPEMVRHAGWLAAGQADFVAAVADFLPLATALVTRHLDRAEQLDGLRELAGPPLLEDFGEIVRHEINNPLTGILGNAELLLARRDRLPGVAVRRLETIAELAVRLRETVRRLAGGRDGQDRPPRQVRSA